MKTEDTAVSKSALARALKCAPSSITSLISRGLKVRADGRLDRRAALTWIVHSTSGTGGGWNGETRGKVDLHERAQALLARKATATKAERATPPIQGAPQADHGADARRVAIGILQQTAAPLEVLAFARVCLRAGCTPVQVYVLAGWFGIQPAVNLAGLSCDDLADAAFPEPTPAQWRGLLGEAFDFAAGDELENDATWQEISPAAKPAA